MHKIKKFLVINPLCKRENNSLFTPQCIVIGCVFFGTSSKGFRSKFNFYYWSFPTQYKVDMRSAMTTISNIIIINLLLCLCIKRIR